MKKIWLKCFVNLWYNYELWKISDIKFNWSLFWSSKNLGVNISLIGETITKIITGVNKLTSFSIQYIPFELNIFNNLKNALMNSKITNLGLSYTKIPENNLSNLHI